MTDRLQISMYSKSRFSSYKRCLVLLCLLQLCVCQCLCHSTLCLTSYSSCTGRVFARAYFGSHPTSRVTGKRPGRVTQPGRGFCGFCQQPCLYTVGMYVRIHNDNIGLNENPVCVQQLKRSTVCSQSFQSGLGQW